MIERLRRRWRRSPKGPALSPYLEDGRLLTAAALAHGLNVLLLPRQVMIARNGAASEAVSFVHGVPESSTLSAVTYAQNKRVTRQLLQAASIQESVGATFSFVGIQDALGYADSIGYPVALRLAIDDDAASRPITVEDPVEFERAIAHLRQVPEDQAAAASSLTRSAYALTSLLPNVRDERGNELRAPSTRYLVQKVRPGQSVRAIVLDGRMAVAILLDEDAGSATDITKALHPSLRKRVGMAAEAVPGLTAAAVGLHVEDHTLPAQQQSWWVTDVAERLRLDLCAQAHPGLAQQLAADLLGMEAARAGLPLHLHDRGLRARVRLEGVPDPRGFVGTFRSACKRRGTRGQARVADEVAGIVEAAAAGSPDGLATVFEEIMSGAVPQQRAIALEAIIG